ncbi:MAG: ABC transporter permease [Gemmatimonadaceae bacterium]
MRKLRMLRPGVRRLFGLDIVQKNVVAAELEDELQMHIELRTEQLMQKGLSREAALAQARALYGNIQTATDDIHRHARRREHIMNRRNAIDSLTQDIRYAFRTLGRQKTWTAIAILTLSVGIGANTAVFSVVNDLLLNPLRYPHGDELVLITRVNEKSGFSTSPTVKHLDAWKSARSIQAIEGTSGDDMVLALGSEPSTVHSVRISPTFASFAGARILKGRTFQRDETVKGAPSVAMISEHLWKNRFGSAPDVIGRLINLDATNYTIIGVMGDGVRTSAFASDESDVWLPFNGDVGFLNGPAIGRLGSGMTIATATQELQTLANQIDHDNGVIGGTAFNIAIRNPGSTGQTRQSVLMLAGAVCLLLLIACANVAHLLLARGAAREREMAIRAALGAGRGRIVRQLLTESLILATAGCAGGLVIGMMALRAIVTLRPPTMPELALAHVDARVLVVTVVLSLVTGIVFGLVAGFQGQGKRRFSILRSSIASTGDQQRNRLRSLLVVTESALSVVLLIGAALLIRSVIKIGQIDPGFNAAGAYAMPVNLNASRYSDVANRNSYATQLLAEAKRMPDVVDATIASGIPTRSGVIIGQWIAEGVPEMRAENSKNFTGMNTIRPEYFQIMGMHLFAGKTFDETSAAQREVIIGKALAHQLWGNENAVGRRFRNKNSTNKADAPIDWNVVVGVAADASTLGLMHNETMPSIYFPAGNRTDKMITLIVRMKAGAVPNANLRRISLALDGTMPPPNVLRLADLLAISVAPQRFIMVLLTLFASLAVMLSAIGLYGVITYMVSQSTREIGVRIALGAGRSDVVRMVMRQGVVLSGIGLAIGLVASIWGTRLLEASLYGVTASDPVSYAAGAVVLFGLAIVACISPTRRALRIDPMVAMRAD